MDKQAIFDTLKKVLSEKFDLKADTITPESRLNEDLKLDSIDAVDLIVELKSMLPRNINPAEFKKVRTLQDVVDVIHAMIANG
ncbi:MAG: acyl carrier protein [Fibromonadales bacterium]|nr:acyl carrier protein [Fibromonadales bacterium]